MRHCKAPCASFRSGTSLPQALLRPCRAVSQRQRAGPVQCVAFFGWFSQQAQAKAERTLYEVLGVSQYTSTKGIKRAFRQKAKELHPDVNKRRNADEAFKALKRAYDTLGNEQKRREYDSIMERKKSNIWASTSKFWGGFGGQQAAQEQQQHQAPQQQPAAAAAQAQEAASSAAADNSPWGKYAASQAENPAREQSAWSPTMDGFDPYASKPKPKPRGATRRVYSGAYRGDDFEACFVASQPDPPQHMLGGQFGSTWVGSDTVVDANPNAGSALGAFSYASSSSGYSGSSSSGYGSGSSSSAGGSSAEYDETEWLTRRLSEEDKVQLLAELKAPYRDVATDVFGSDLRRLNTLEELLDICEQIEGLRASGIPLAVAASAISLLPAHSTRKKPVLQNAREKATRFLPGWVPAVATAAAAAAAMSNAAAAAAAAAAEAPAAAPQRQCVMAMA